MKFFRHFTVEKKSLLFPAEMRVANKYATCEECLSIKSLFAPKFLVYRGKIKGSETVLRLILSEKKLIPHKNNRPAFQVKMLLLTGNFNKAYKVRNLFVRTTDENLAIFFKFGAWRTVKTRACLKPWSNGPASSHKWTQVELG